MFSSTGCYVTLNIYFKDDDERPSKANKNKLKHEATYEFMEAPVSKIRPDVEFINRNIESVTNFNPET